MPQNFSQLPQNPLWDVVGWHPLKVWYPGCVPPAPFSYAPDPFVQDSPLQVIFSVVGFALLISAFFAVHFPPRCAFHMLPRQAVHSLSFVVLPPLVDFTCTGPWLTLNHLDRIFENILTKTISEKDEVGALHSFPGYTLKDLVARIQKGMLKAVGFSR